ncbi:MAG: hypothetical protein JST68_27040 [Bacteroidetes bacterium]|nr:hypothetical protein [Bacteroidota bacterium]
MKKYLLVGITLTFLLTFYACSKVIPPIPKPTQTLHDSTRLDSTGKDTSGTKKDTIAIPKDTAKHDTVPAPKDTATKTPPFPEQVAAAPPAPSCPIAPIYGDTIIFPQPTNGGADYIVRPVNFPGPGKYFSWPQGMTIDVNTGAINVTKSETGLKYAIGFVPQGSTDTCLSTLVIGGASYMDSVYVLSLGANAAVPYFDADPFLLSKCADGTSCSFDVNGTAASKKVIVNPATGVIDLQKTLDGTSLLGLGGAFGLLPVNGSAVTATIYYKLNDQSNDALQHIDVQVVYFETKDAVSAGLLGGVVNKLNNLLSGHLISNKANPRPPLIVIVRRLH